MRTMGATAEEQSAVSAAGTQAIGEAAELPRSSIGFAAICLGYFAIILDGSVLNVAVPSIRGDFGSSLAGAQWVLGAYALTLAGLLLTAGALGDRVGLRRMFLGGGCVFTAASVACAAAPSILALIAARVVLGVGAAALLPATLALIPYLLRDRAGQARAAVVWVGIGAGAVALGPLVGGLLIDAFGWRSVFLINLPIGIVSVLLGRTCIAETPRRPRRVDRFGQVTAVIAMALVTAAVIHGGQSGWRSPVTIGMLVAGLLVALAFWTAEGHIHEPMLPPVFFADRVRTVAVICSALMGFLFYGTLFMMSLYFQQARGWIPGSTGDRAAPPDRGNAGGSICDLSPVVPPTWPSRTARRRLRLLRTRRRSARTDRRRQCLCADRGWPRADRPRQHRVIFRTHVAVARECQRGAIGRSAVCAGEEQSSTSLRPHARANCRERDRLRPPRCVGAVPRNVSNDRSSSSPHPISRSRSSITVCCQY
jgi:DHA2 family methylenomycin A resistance protein-like MFS transporter